MFQKIVPLILSIFFINCIFLSGCTTSTGFPTPTYTAFTQTNEYIIGAGDLLRIQVMEAKDSVISMVVSPDGIISLPLIGNIAAAGQTQAQLKKILTDKYHEYYKHPDTVLNIDEVRSLRAFIVGEVRTSGEFKFLSRTSVLGAIARAAGTNEFSSGKILLIRKKNAETVKYIFTLKELIEQESQHAPVYLERDDIIVVD